MDVRVAVAQVMPADPLRPDCRAKTGTRYHCAQDHVCTEPCLGHHRGQPIPRGLGVSVGAGQPQFAGRASAADSGTSPGAAGQTYIPGGDDDRLHPTAGGRDQRCRVAAAVQDDHDPGLDARIGAVQMVACCPDAGQAAADQLLFIGGRHDDRDSPDQTWYPAAALSTALPSWARSRSA